MAGVVGAAEEISFVQIDTAFLKNINFYVANVV